MGNQHIHIIGNPGVVSSLTVGDAVAHEHRYSIELHSVNCDSGVAEIMDVIVKAIDIGAIKAVVMIAADEDLVLIWKVAKPVQEVDSLLLRTYYAEVTGMHHNISLGQIPKPTMATMSI